MSSEEKKLQFQLPQLAAMIFNFLLFVEISPKMAMSCEMSWRVMGIVCLSGLKWIACERQKAIAAAHTPGSDFCLPFFVFFLCAEFPLCKHERTRIESRDLKIDTTTHRWAFFVLEVNVRALFELLFWRVVYFWTEDDNLLVSCEWEVRRKMKIIKER
jgi:hypothetical protein